MEAKLRFDKWWDNPALKGNTAITGTAFHGKIACAVKNLNDVWIKQQKKMKQSAHPLPVWSHDQIVAATDFSAWHFILNGDFAAKKSSDNKHSIWPTSTGRVFRQYGTISPVEKTARRTVQKHIVKMREYRNRLFHHEPLWIKAPNVTDAATAIATIRNKIYKAESLIRTIERDHEKNGAVQPCAA